MTFHQHLLSLGFVQNKWVRYDYHLKLSDRTVYVHLSGRHACYAWTNLGSASTISQFTTLDELELAVIYVSLQP